MKITISTLLFTLALATPVLAEDPAAEQATGTETREWLALQKSGNAAKGEARPMPGEVADKVFERYANSFANPLPQSFPRDSVSSSGDGKK